MSHRPTRRRFLKTSTFAGLSVWIASRDSRAAEPASPNEKLNIGIIGTTGRGGENLHGVSSENIVALCDVDDNLLGPVAQKYPKAAHYNDFRKMLDEAKNLDAVVVSTADHCHANATVMALRSANMSTAKSRSPTPSPKRASSPPKPPRQKRPRRWARRFTPATITAASSN